MKKILVLLALLVSASAFADVVIEVPKNVTGCVVQLEYVKEVFHVYSFCDLTSKTQSFGIGESDYMEMRSKIIGAYVNAGFKLKHSRDVSEGTIARYEYTFVRYPEKK